MNNFDSTYLREVLEYNPETGIFTWKNPTATCVKVGDIAGWIDFHGYHSIRLNKKIYRSHRLAWLYVYGKFPEKSIDHINGIRTDNRIKNLREATVSENAQNQRKSMSNNKTGYLGVSKITNKNKWCAFIKVNGKNKNLGTFETPELAAIAYLDAKRNLHVFNTI
jgi:hypothetical protein